jgi:hypothetical protein
LGEKIEEGKSEERAGIVLRGRRRSGGIGYRVLPLRVGSVDRGKLVHAFRGVR